MVNHNLDGRILMKNLIVVCLLAAIGAVLWIERADAQAMGACFTRNGITRCRPSPRPPGPPVGPQEWRRHHHPVMPFPPRWRGPSYVAPPAPPPLAFNSSCVDLAQRLIAQGYNNVEMLSCAGRTYIYRAWRGGQRLTVYVSSRSGRIRRIAPAY